MKKMKISVNCIRKLIQWSLPLALAVVLLLSMSFTAFAAADSASLDWSWNGKSSITVELKDENDTLVTDGELTIYQVALLGQDNGNMVYTFTSDFAGYGVSLDDVSSNSSDLASKLTAYVSTKSITGTSATNTNGTVVFDNLELGLYLIVQTAESSGYYTMNPFIVSVPLDVNDTWIYNVDASPKVGVLTPVPDEPEETNEPEEPGTPETETSEPATTASTITLPQTGQLNWPVPVLAVCGLFLIVLGSVLVYSDSRRCRRTNCR